MATRYLPEQKGAWDAFVEASLNGTFLFCRDYMDYHRERFEDCSIVFTLGNQIAALFPCNREADAVTSHAGLTYGGLIVDTWASADRVLDMLATIVEVLRRDGVRTLIYKTIPSIYHSAPAEDDRYALFRLGAHVIRRDVWTVISPTSPWLPGRKRRSSWRRAQRLMGVRVERSHDWLGYWRVLSERLREKYDASPVHSLAEMMSLAATFPTAIRLLTATLDGQVAAGAVLYETPCVSRTQYLGANAEARAHGLLDLVLLHAIDEARAAGKWFDFGASTVGETSCLNRGLVRYKESFGGRTIVQDTYRLDIP